MGRTSDFTRARRENMMLRFLVEKCAEMPGLEILGTRFWQEYLDFWRSQTILGRAVEYMEIGTFYQLLQEAGIKKETRMLPGPKGRPYAAVYFLGVGMKSQVTPEVREDQGMPGLCRLTPDQEGPLVGPLVASQQEAEACQKVMAGTHIMINGTLYDRKLISTIRPIRPFLKSGSNEEMTHIVTFNNSEIRHQFVSKEDARSIESVLV